MKQQLTYLLIIFLSATLTAQSGNQKKIKVENEDKEILEKIFSQLKNKKDKTTAELIEETGRLLLETPYVAHTLETDKEQLVINLRELDCTTYAENCLAIARTIKKGKLTFKQFTKELTLIRYRNGSIDGYPSRLHYFSDWIFENDSQGFVKRVTEQISNTPYPLEVNYMSNHPDSYKQLTDNNDFIARIAKKEKEISSRKMFYIPENRVTDFEDKLKVGDIVGITTSIEGMDIQHVVILVKKNDRIHIMHASSKAEKVIVSEGTLEDYLLGNKRATGIMVARPL
ncbi:MAG: N-acetylmuramoyl-L-alanine amidase-like domain-containing protein [Bacteroidota bacterium]